MQRIPMLLLICFSNEMSLSSWDSDELDVDNRRIASSNYVLVKSHSFFHKSILKNVAEIHKKVRWIETEIVRYHFSLLFLFDNVGCFWLV